MRKFQFQLEPVLRLKKQMERLVEMNQQSAQLALDTVRRQAESLERQMTDNAMALDQSMTKPVPATTWTARYRYQEQLARLLDEVDKRSELAQQALERISRERARIATDVKAIEQLKSIAWQRFRRDEQRIQQNRLDESVMRRWQPNRSGKYHSTS